MIRILESGLKKAKATRNMALTNFAYGIRKKRLGGSTGSY